jgi:hypothetical protein
MAHWLREQTTAMAHWWREQATAMALRRLQRTMASRLACPWWRCTCAAVT